MNKKTNKELENLLYNAILAWYDDSMESFHGLDDENFINRVCERTDMPEEDYRELILEKSNAGEEEKEDTFLILSNNSECDKLGVYSCVGTRDDAYKKMQALILDTAVKTDVDDYLEVHTNSSETTGYIQWAESREDFRMVRLSDISDIDEAGSVKDANLDAILDDIDWDNEFAHYALHDVGREEELNEEDEKWNEVMEDWLNILHTGCSRYDIT